MRRTQRQGYFFDAAAARLASRDFLRFALFLWMMPRAAALSWADAAAVTFSLVGASTAFLYEDFSDVLTPRLRLRRFSDARAHFLAELMLGKPRSPLSIANADKS